MVASGSDLLNNNEGDLWNSRKVFSDTSINVKYEGETLKTGVQYYWKVKVWNKNSNESEWSDVAFWSMGLLNPDDWKAKWIGFDKTVGKDDQHSEKTVISARYLRKELNIEKEILYATAYISGIGSSELYLNGQKVGDDVLSPGQTQFNKRVLYVTHDITENLKSGTNAVGVILGAGRYYAMRHDVPMKMEHFGFPKLLLQIEINYIDGTKDILISDESWKLTADGPITENNEFDGEKYDARKEMLGWSADGFDDSKWKNANLVEKPCDLISPQMNEPIRVTEVLNPISVKEVKPGMYVFDMGQNMVGWAQLRVNAPSGTEVKLRFSEAINKDGTLYLDNIRSADVTDVYICKGGDEEIWEPRFTYHGFRYVEVTGYPGKPKLSTIRGHVVHDNVALIGSFECSNKMINSIYENGVWGIRGNYRSFPTDCPQRDERMAWLGDRATGSRGESYIHDISKLYAKWMRDIGDAQLKTGSISDVSPAYWKLYNDNITWDGTPIILANMLYEQYGDFEIIRNSYPYLKKWYVYMIETYMKEGIMPRDSYGDWCMPPKIPELIHSTDIERITSGSFLGTSFFYHMTTLMHDFAKMMNIEEDVSYFNTNVNLIHTAFNKTFFDKEHIIYSNNTATASILALAFGLVEDQFKEQVFRNILEKIEVQHKGHIPVGLVGAQFLLRTLTEYGAGDIAYRFATQTDYPSWGYMVEDGATTIWELWNGNTADPAMNSRNHVMLLGDFNIWLYEDLGAIKPFSPGFKTIEMKPTLINLDYVKASHNSPYGKIESSWLVYNDIFSWDINIPVNTSAMVYVPASDKKSIKIDGKSISKIASVKYMKEEDDFIVLEIGSGVYKIESTGFKLITNYKNITPIPEVIIEKNVSTEPVKVKMICSDKDAKIRYTTDGTKPNEYSKQYTKPFEIKKSTQLLVKSFKEDSESSFMIDKTIDIYDKSTNGLNYAYYEGKWTMLPDFSKLTPVKKGRVNNIEKLENIKQREDYWGIVFTGFIHIESEDIYTFSISSDDGTRLFIDDKMIFDNDGIHGVQERQGLIDLTKGRHKIRIEYFEGNYGEILKFQVSGNDFPIHKVPRSMLFFE